MFIRCCYSPNKIIICMNNFTSVVLVNDQASNFLYLNVYKINYSGQWQKVRSFV